MKNKIVTFIKKYYPYIILFIFTFIFLLSSPSSIIGNGLYSVDSGVFQYIGKIMAKGLIPYKDAFDHKGLLLYFINFIPALFNSKHFIWFIELILMFITIIYSYEICNLFTNKKSISLIVCIVSLFSLGSFYQGGNYCEEYALLPIIISLYIYLKRFINNKLLTKKDCLIIGILCGCILWLRPNLIAIDIVLIIYVIYDGIINKNIKYIFNSALYFILGIMIISLPFIIYLLLNNNLNNAIFDYIIFNFEYSLDSDKESLLTLIFYWLKEYKLIVVSLIIAIILMLNKKSRKVGIFSLILSIITLILISISGREYGHYALIILPCVLIPLTVFFEEIVKKSSFKNEYYFINVAALIIISIILIYGGLEGEFKGIKSQFSNEDKNKVTKLLEVTNYIKENTNEDDCILSWANDSKIYLYSERYACNKYFFQGPIFDINEDIKNEFMNEFLNNKPKIIVVESQGNLSYFKEKNLIYNYIDLYYSMVRIDTSSYSIYKLKE